MRPTNSSNLSSYHPYSGMALTEVIISMSVAAVGVGCIISGYVLAVQQAEISACSAAVHWTTLKKMEQIRSARWEPLAATPVDELVQSNFPPTVSLLDIPVTSTKSIYATNQTTITLLPGSPMLKMIRVDSAWAYLSRGPFTNSVVSYRNPDR